MTETTQAYRCNAPDFVSDVLDFVSEQISRAVDDPLDRLAATVTAAGVVPIMRERLAPKDEARRAPEDVELWGNLVLFLSPYLDRADGDELASLGEKSPVDFVIEAARIIDRINYIQDNLLTPS